MGGSDCQSHNVLTTQIKLILPRQSLSKHIRVTCNVLHFSFPRPAHAVLTGSLWRHPSTQGRPVLVTPTHTLAKLFRSHSSVAEQIQLKNVFSLYIIYESKAPVSA